METKLEQIAAKAAKQQPKSVVREIRTPRSVGTGGRRLPPVTRCGQQWPSLPESRSALNCRSRSYVCRKIWPNAQYSGYIAGKAAPIIVDRRYVLRSSF